MVSEIGYVVFLLIELIVSFSIAAYIGSLLFSSLMGAPYVPTKQKDLEETLKAANLKKNQVFLELGSGDGRVTRTAAKLYGVQGLGIDVNPLLIWYARFLAKLHKVRNCTFQKQNIFNTDFSKADVIYQFLMPELIKKLFPKYRTEIKKGTIIISHGFEIYGLQKYLIKTVERKPFPSYIYRR